MESFANLFEQHSLQLEMREGEVVDHDGGGCFGGGCLGGVGRQSGTGKAQNDQATLHGLGPQRCVDDGQRRGALHMGDAGDAEKRP